MKSKKTPSTTSTGPFDKLRIFDSGLSAGSGPDRKGGPEPKSKVKIKSLKLTKEPVENLSERDAGGVRGGQSSSQRVTSGGGSGPI